MPWVYSQANHTMSHNDTAVTDNAYSGRDMGRNNPTAQTLEGIGPIPQGRYRIGPGRLGPHTGPLTMNLDPIGNTNTYGRTLFRIHGDNRTHTASDGCVILPHDVRARINSSSDRELVVVP